MSTAVKRMDPSVAQSEVTELVRAKLAGKPPDPVALVDDLLGIASAVGELSCRLSNGKGFRFSLRGLPQSFDVELDRARAKLRMLCARLAVLVSETDGQGFPIYGGEGRITRSLPALNGSAGQLVEYRLHLRHQNSNAAPIEFTLTAL